jgi:PII-like signaling protein
MTSLNDWKQLNIYLTEGHRYRHGQLYIAVVEAARKQGLAGATVTRAITGFGASRNIRTTRILELSVDLPLVVTIIDREEAIARFMPTLREMLRGQLVTLQPIEVLFYTALPDR